MLTTIILVLVGAAIGYLSAHKIAGGVSNQAAGIAGGVAGLIVGLFLKPIIWFAIVAAIAVAAYYIWGKKA